MSICQFLIQEPVCIGAWPRRDHNTNTNNITNIVSIYVTFARTFDNFFENSYTTRRCPESIVQFFRRKSDKAEGVLLVMIFFWNVNDAAKTKNTNGIDVV